jgi:hypothetical protein
MRRWRASQRQRCRCSSRSSATTTHACGERFRQHFRQNICMARAGGLACAMAIKPGPEGSEPASWGAYAGSVMGCLPADAARCSALVVQGVEQGEYHVPGQRQGEQAYARPPCLAHGPMRCERALLHSFLLHSILLAAGHVRTVLVRAHRTRLWRRTRACSSSPSRTSHRGGPCLASCKCCG